MIVGSVTKARIGTEGVSVFTIVRVDEDAQSAIIESAADSPGKYTFPAKLANLAGYLMALPNPSS